MLGRPVMSASPWRSNLGCACLLKPQYSEEELQQQQQQSQSLGQLPQPNGYYGQDKGNPGIVYASQQVASQAECAGKGGVLFDSQRFCCVKINPYTGKAEPTRASDYGWYCAQTTFGAPVTSTSPSPFVFGPSSSYGAASPLATQSSIFGGSDFLPLAVAGGVALLLLSRRQ